MKRQHVLLILRIIVAIILIQTLRYKFTAHPDSVYIFETLGLEPLGRIAIGIFELIAGILLLIPKSVWAGSLLSLGLMFGAILSHITQLGIEVRNDNGVLFMTAIITAILSAILVFQYRKTIPVIGSRIMP